MRRQQRKKIDLSSAERAALESLVRKQTERQSIVMRAKIILLADEGLQHQEIAQELATTGNTVSVWVARWRALAGKPPQARLEDAPRPGAPDKFSAEQLCQIIAIACENPADHGRPITHWTHRELAQVVIEKGIVDSISVSHLGALLKKTTCNPTAVNIGSTPSRTSARKSGSPASANSTSALRSVALTRFS